MDNSNGNRLPQPRDQLSSLSTYASNGKIMLFSGVILFAAILIVLCFHTYARWLFNLRHRRRHILSLSASNAAPAPQGLHPSVLKTLPLLHYSSKIHEAVLECAVCLSEFRDLEEGRVLPSCKHTFHSCCIDMWFRSHSNCPLCRAPVHDTRADTVIPVMEAADLRQKEENQRFCSASTPPARLLPLQCQKITLDLVGILVEVPTSSGQQTRTGLSSDPSVQFGPEPNGRNISSDL